MHDYQFFDRERIDALLEVEFQCLKAQRTQAQLVKEAQKREGKQRKQAARTHEREKNSLAAATRNAQAKPEDAGLAAAVARAQASLDSAEAAVESMRPENCESTKLQVSFLTL